MRGSGRADQPRASGAISVVKAGYSSPADGCASEPAAEGGEQTLLVAAAAYLALVDHIHTHLRARPTAEEQEEGKGSFEVAAIDVAGVGEKRAPEMWRASNLSITGARG